MSFLNVFFSDDASVAQNVPQPPAPSKSFCRSFAISASLIFAEMANEVTKCGYATKMAAFLRWPSFNDRIPWR